MLIENRGHEDPLKEALNRQKTHQFYNIKVTQSDFFKKRICDFEHFGLSFVQRICAFSISLFVGLLLLFYSMTRLFATIYNPASFVLPYALSNIIFFFMFGFLSGFKSYFKNLLNRHKRPFTIAFVLTTVITLYSTIFSRGYLIHLLLVVCQVVSFVCFTITFLPGGASGMASLLKLVFRK